MSSEGQLGPKKLRKLSAELGVNLHSAWAWSPKIECLSEQGEHFWYNPRTREKAPVTEWRREVPPKNGVLK